MKILNAVKVHDPNTFQPKMQITFELTIEPKDLSDTEIFDYESFGKEFFSRLKLFQPKRPNGTTFYKISEPAVRLKYSVLNSFNIEDPKLNFDGTFATIIKEAQTHRLSGLNLEEQIIEKFGKDCDVFFYHFITQKYCSSEAKEEFTHMARFAVVTKEEREKYHLNEYIDF